MNRAFSRIAGLATEVTGSWQAATLAFGVVVLWAVSGPWFNFSQNWQLVINTGTTIITFLMVFLIQHQQNKDSRAMHTKLDFLMKDKRRAQTFVGLEHETEDEIKAEEEKLIDQVSKTPARTRDAAERGARQGAEEGVLEAVEEISAPARPPRTKKPAKKRVARDDSGPTT